MDPSGALSIAEHGTVLAEARTRSFDVLSHENYVAPGLGLSFLSEFYLSAHSLLEAQTRLTQCFLRQGARIHSYASNSP
jgi:hypothetical protein